MVTMTIPLQDFKNHLNIDDVIKFNIFILKQINRILETKIMEYQFYGEKIEKKNGETSKRDNH